MRALALTAVGGAEHLAVLDLPEPPLAGVNDVRIGVRAVALNHLDLWVAEGLPAVPVPALPHIVAADAVGTVLEIGSAVTRVRPGDRVAIYPASSCGECEACKGGDEVFCRQFGVRGEHSSGVAAEQVVVADRYVFPIHDKLSWADAAAVYSLTTLTAWRMLTTRAALEPGDVVLIWGIGGGVAMAALQLARHLGARVAVTSSADDKLDRAETLGAELVLRHGSGTDVPAEVKRHFGHGADVIVDSIGSATWARSLKALRPGGRLVTCGATTGPTVELDLRRLFWFQWSLLGSTMGTLAEFAEAVSLGERGVVVPIVDRVYPLDRAREAYQRLTAGEQLGKLVLEVAS